MKDPAEGVLSDAIGENYAEWAAEHDMSPGVVRDWILIVGAVGFNDDGEDIEQIMIVPSGPAYALQGLLEEARLRFRAETFVELTKDD